MYDAVTLHEVRGRADQGHRELGYMPPQATGEGTKGEEELETACAGHSSRRSWTDLKITNSDQDQGI